MVKSKEEIAKMTVKELGAALKELGAPATGKKEELVERYYTLLQEQEGGQQPEAAAAKDPEPAAADTPAEDPAAATEKSVAAEAEVAPTSGEPKKRAHAAISFDQEHLKQMPDLKKIQVVNTAPEPAPAAAATLKVVTEAEKKKLRADRFKDPAGEKLKERAARFGMVHPEIEKEKAKKRAERFGLSHPDLDAEKKQQRAARFGIVSEETKLALRAERFKPLPASASTMKAVPLTGDEEEKRKARAARFAAAQ